MVDTGFVAEVEGFAVEVEGFAVEVEGFVVEVEGFVASVAVVEEEFVDVFILDDEAVVPGEFSEAAVDVTAGGIRCAFGTVGFIRRRGRAVIAFGRRADILLAGGSVAVFLVGGRVAFDC